MADLRSEEEQLDVIKRWWKDNGTSLIAGVVIAAAGVFGWNAWQNYQERHSEAASVRYQQLVNLTAGTELDEERLADARELVAELNDDYSKTLYAELALLLDARLAVLQGNLEDAQNSLEQVANNSSRRYIKSLAWLRLARIEIAADNADEALNLLDKSIVESLAAQQADVRGDAYAALGETEHARDAWQSALELSQQQGQPIYGVQLKLDDLGTEEAAQ